uniref:Apple domain-containing protein n=1 Tax=Ditylenchus dipsaci TaxID=166011 RepID=A0A915ETQ4_9BILA
MLFGWCTRCIVSRETNISRTLSLLIFVTLISSVFGRSPYIRCFQRNIRHSIDNSQPLAELFYVRPYDCLNQCILSTNNAVESEGLCRSVVYNYLQHSCRLYDHDGRKVPAILHPANGYDYFRRTATTQECGGPMQRFLAKKRLLPPGNLNGKYPVKSLALEQDQKSNNEKRRFGNKRPDPSANQMPEPVFPEITSDLSNMPLSNSGQLPEETGITTTIAPTKFDASMEEVKSLDEALASKDKASPVDVDIFSAFSEGGSANKEVVHPSTTASTRSDTTTPGTTSIAATTTSSSTLFSDFEPAAEEVTARTTIKTTATEKPRNRFQLRPESSGGLPRGSMQNVHLPNSASELGYEENESSATDSSPSLMLAGESENASSVTVMPFKQQQPPSSMITDDHISSVESTTTNPEQKTCSTSTAYYVVIGNEIILPISGSESDVTILHGVEQSKCAKYCSSNTGPKGESLKCSSINYFH